MDWEKPAVRWKESSISDDETELNDSLEVL